MDQKVIGLYLSRILSGCLLFLYNSKRYKLYYPDINLKYQAELYAQERYEDAKYNDWIQDDNVVDILINLGLWTFQGDSALEKMEKQIEDYKVQLYENFLNPSKTKTLKRQLAAAKGSYDRYYNVRHSFDSYTPSGYLQILKNQYILINSLYDEKDQKIFNSIKNSDYNLLNQLSATINDYNIDMSVYRQIARSDAWKNYWSANNDYIFDKPAVQWTDEQKTLVIMTKMYDSAYSHPECPPESIINDDDMFDGWMIHQKREAEKNKNKGRTEKLLKGKNLDKANEIFVMAHSQEEAQNIHELNDNASKHIIKERNVVIEQNQSVESQNLPDAQRQLIMQSNQLFKDGMRK